MEETWDEFAKRKRKEFGTSKSIGKVMTGRFSGAPWIELSRNEKLFNLHRRTLPIGVDKIIMFAVSRNAADKMQNRLTKVVEEDNKSEDCLVKIYYEVIPVDATSRELSVYFNNKKLII